MTQKRLIDTLREIRIGNANPRAWVERLEERERKGEILTPAQREMLRAAKQITGKTSDTP